jgi:hypothetical protein
MQSKPVVLVCGNVFDGVSEDLSCSEEFLVQVAEHAGAAKGCKQGVRYRVQSFEHAYLIDEEGLEMAKEAGTCERTLRMKCTTHRCQSTSGSSPKTAAFIPSCSSLTTSLTPFSPRSMRPRSNDT